MGNESNIAKFFLSTSRALHEKDLIMAEYGMNQYRGFLREQGLEDPDPPADLLPRAFVLVKLALDDLAASIERGEQAGAIPPPKKGRLT